MIYKFICYSMLIKFSLKFFSKSSAFKLFI
nr:MAG TPA: hypothetical protein [Crassvirales sp.]